MGLIHINAFLQTIYGNNAFGLQLVFAICNHSKFAYLAVVELSCVHKTPLVTYLMNVDIT